MSIRLREIRQVDDRHLAVVFTDGASARFDVVALRRACPCAECVDENTGIRLVDPASIPESVRPTTLRSVGRYALAVAWDDGHVGGIYTFERLRRMVADLSG
jgi:DUF971 family protein